MFKYAGFVSRAGLRVVSYNPWIKRYAKHPEKYDISKRYSKVHIFLKKCVHNFKVEFFLEGLENLKSDSNFVLIPNHQSNMDPLSLLAICENPISFSHIAYCSFVKVLWKCSSSKRSYKPFAVCTKKVI